MSFLSLVTVVVENYDSAISFYCEVLGFELTEDSPSETNDGRPKRWVVVTPPGAQTGLLLAQADGPTQSLAVGNQTAGRVAFFLRVDDFTATFDRLVAHNVNITSQPRQMSYGTVAVFEDICGNKWDLLGPV
jgi:catechol 2,3-dioxygenase-like lactoylglutathione lyase family enzyme